MSTAGLQIPINILAMHIFCSYTQELECLSTGCMVFPADSEFKNYEAPVLNSGLFAFLANQYKSLQSSNACVAYPGPSFIEAKFPPSLKISSTPI